MNIPPVKINFLEQDISFIMNEISTILRSGILTLGPYTYKFEKEFAKMVGTNYAIAVSSGTASLEILLTILGVEGKEIIIPANTNFATAAAVIKAGGVCKFIDIESQFMGIEIDEIKKNINRETAGIISVHIGGIIAPNHLEIMNFCKEHGLIIIEDAAHAHGSIINEKKAGSLSVGGAFSFFPTKVVTCCEGGIITTNDEKIYSLAKSYRDQGKDPLDHRKSIVLGNSWRMSEIHAAVGIQSLKRLEENINNRIKISNFYDERLNDNSLFKPINIPSNIKSNYYKYIVHVNNNIDILLLKKKLSNNYQITLSGEVYSFPCYKHPAFRTKIKISKELKNTDYFCRHHICLPIYNDMTFKEADYVINSLLKCSNDILRNQ